MKNPYINENMQNKAPQSTLDKSINEAASNMPFVPENFNTAGFLKGLAVGAIGAYLLTNEKAQQTLFRAIIKGGALLNAGFEELKERFEDAKAEIAAEEE
ncbi:YtxH domain-containing protein [Campylobacter sp. 19-13652]|uniref:YtxH domain-containing protein n=1 Tax=Campylobacter sp. 19-13652 TaxID=2840180 RepID=UPI001C7822DD|nr:YtxH domain-containing protein [Campylobacter sp. 19-13652]BCX79176.1 hypothetical protein LBC_06380 [Campylobacter sp. 19-13652]